MDYEKFKKDEYESFEGIHERLQMQRYDLDGSPYGIKETLKLMNLSSLIGRCAEDTINLEMTVSTALVALHRWKVEAIDIIEDAIKDAPNVSSVGFLTGTGSEVPASLWLKDNPAEDAKKARWYLDRFLSLRKLIKRPLGRI